MASKKAKTPPRKTLKSPPRKPLRRIEIQSRPPDGDLDEEGLELGTELDSGDLYAEFQPSEEDLADMEAGPDGLGDGPDDLSADQADLPPLASRPTRRANKHTIFPEPGTFKLSWDAGRQYWKKLWDDPRTRARLRVYIYRWFPAMLDEKSPKTGVSYRQVVRLEGDVPDSKPELLAKPLTISEMLHRYGTGDYGFKINDAGAGNQQICQFALVDRADMRDWENHPPILDPDGIDLSDPMNATYIKQMKSRQKWDSDEDKEETMQALERMADRMVKLAEKQSERRPQEDSSKAAEVVAHAATLGQELLAGSVRQLIENRGGGGGGSTDTMAMVTALVELVKGMKGENQLEIISSVMQRAAEAERAAYNAQISGLQSTVQQMMSKMDQRPNPGGPEDDPLDRYRKMLEMKEIMGDLFDKGGKVSGGGREPWFVQYMPLILQASGPLLASLSYLFQSLGAKQAGGAVPPPPVVPSIPGPGIPGGMGAVPHAPGPVPVHHPGQPAPPSATPEQAFQILEQIRGPLLRYLNEGRSGYEFADLFIEFFGAEAYEQISAQPPAMIMQVMSAYPPLWGDLAPRQQQVLQFLEEFVSEPPPDHGDRQEADGTGSESKPNGSLPNQGVPIGAGSGVGGGPTPVEKKTGKRART